MRKLLSLGYSSLLRWSWLLRNFRPLRHYIERSHGVGQLRPIMARRWHRGSKYFRGVAANGELIFIKMDGDSRLLQNEVDAWTHLRQTVADSRHFAGMRFFDFASEYRVAALEWVDGEPLRSYLAKNPPEEKLRGAMREMVAILGELSLAGMVHRDFTPDNLLVSSGPTANSISVVLIDFAFAAIADAAPHDCLVSLNDLRDLCHGYKAQEFLWDDAYSCLMIFEEIRQSTGIEDEASLAEVRNRLAARTFCFDAAAARRARVGCFATKTVTCA